jgi:hypothetical protein
MAQCVETDDSGCNQRYGTFYPDKCCEDIECDADDYGRCCIFDASLSGTECVTTTQSICTSLGGDWGGGGTNCTGGNPCDPD